MHLKENMKPLILVAPETQVDARNRPEDQLLARQHTYVGIEMQCNILEIIVIGERALENGS